MSGWGHEIPLNSGEAHKDLVIRGEVIKFGLNTMSLSLHLDKEDYILLKQRMDTEMRNLTNKQKH